MPIAASTATLLTSVYAASSKESDPSYIWWLLEEPVLQNYKGGSFSLLTVAELLRSHRVPESNVSAEAVQSGSCCATMPLPPRELI